MGDGWGCGASREGGALEERVCVVGIYVHIFALALFFASRGSMYVGNVRCVLCKNISSASSMTVAVGR